MDNNWIVDNLENAFTTWNDKLGEMWTLLTESPQTFKGGTIWQTIVTINGGMQAISRTAKSCQSLDRDPLPREHSQGIEICCKT